MNLKKKSRIIHIKEKQKRKVKAVKSLKKKISETQDLKAKDPSMHADLLLNYSNHT